MEPQDPASQAATEDGNHWYKDDRKEDHTVNSPHHTEVCGTYLRYSLYVVPVGTGAMLNLEFPVLEKGSN